MAGNFPPLAGNPDLFLSREFPAMVALFGMEGKITAEGKTIESVMPPFAHLSDAQIAAAVAYVRGAWGNDKLKPAGLKPVDAAAVAALRKQNADAGAGARRARQAESGKEISGWRRPSSLSRFRTANRFTA